MTFSALGSSSARRILSALCPSALPTSAPTWFRWQPTTGSTLPFARTRPIHPPRPRSAPQHPGARIVFERHAFDLLRHPRRELSVQAAHPVTADEREQRGPAPANNRAAQDRALFARYLDKRDPVDREMLVERFLPLARQLARRYERAEAPFDDLFQVACLGLVKAIDRFDLGREVAFSSYAVPTILGEIKRYFRDRTWSVRVPRDLQELALRVDRAVADLSLGLHRQPTVEEIGAKVGAEEEDVLE